MFRPRDIRERARVIADQVLAASDVALGGNGRGILGDPTLAERHPHRRTATVPPRARRPGRVSPTEIPCLSPVGHRLEHRRPTAAPRGH